MEAPAATEAHRAAWAARLLRLSFIVLVLASAVIVFEAAALSAIETDNPWLKAAPALVPFAGLVATVFFAVGKDAWVAALTRHVALFLQSHRWALHVSAGVMLAASIAFGVYVYGLATAKDGSFTVQIVRDQDVPDQAVADMPVELEQKVTGAKVLKLTDARGIAKFDVDVGEYFGVRVRKSSDPGSGVFVLNSGVLLNATKKAEFALVRLSQVDRDKLWVGGSDKGADIGTTPTAAAPSSGEGLEFARLPATYFRWRETGRPPQVVTADKGIPPWPIELPGAEAIVRHKGFSVGFSPMLRLPRWVAYKIVPGPPIRRERDRFLPDPGLPATYQAEPADYAPVDYDRGHLVRRVDLFGLGEAEMLKVFYMSAVVPQLAYVNRKSWAALEAQTSSQAVDGAEVYVIRGPVYQPAAGDSMVGVTLMGPNSIPVPTHFFQIALVVKGGRSVVEAHLVPNAFVELHGSELTQFRVTTKAIETMTGLNFDARMKP